MKIQNKCCLIIFFSLLCISAYAQGLNNDLLKKALEQLNVTELPAGKQSYHLKYKMRILYQEKETQELITNCEMKITATQAHFISDKFSYFKDASNAFLIMQDQKKILAMHPDFGMLNQQSALESLDFKKDWFDNSTIKNISSNTDKSKSLYEMTPTTVLKDRTKVLKVLVELNTSQQKITRMAIYFTEESAYNIIECIYEKIDYDAILNLNIPVKNLIYQSNGSLKPIYASFQLIDTRKTPQNN